jgi:hypothetical protein
MANRRTGSTRGLAPKRTRLIAQLRSDKMPDMSGAVIPEPVDLEHASPAFRDFFHAHFGDSLIAWRDEFDWDPIARLGDEELALAQRLVRANLARGRIYLDAAGILNDRDAIAPLHALLDDATSLSAQICIARPLWYLERSPKYPALIERLVRSNDAALKRDLIWEIMLLADERAIDHLYTLAGDRDAAVRDLALYQLTILSLGRFRRLFISGDPKPRDLAYFRSRRSHPGFMRRMLRALKRDHEPSTLDS